MQASFDRVDLVEAIQKFGAEMFEGKTWKELLGLPNSALQLLYKGAKSIFDAKRYDEAELAFAFFALIDPKQYQFWLGLGHSAFNIKQREKAINAYAMASVRVPRVVGDEPEIFSKILSGKRRSPRRTLHVKFS